MSSCDSSSDPSSLSQDCADWSGRDLLAMTSNKTPVSRTSSVRKHCSRTGWSPTSTVTIASNRPSLYGDTTAGKKTGGEAGGRRTMNEKIACPCDFEIAKRALFCLFEDLDLAETWKDDKVTEVRGKAFARYRALRALASAPNERATADCLGAPLLSTATMAALPSAVPSNHRGAGGGMLDNSLRPTVLFNHAGYPSHGNGLDGSPKRRTCDTTRCTPPGLRGMGQGAASR